MPRVSDTPRSACLAVEWDLHICGAEHWRSQCGSVASDPLPDVSAGIVMAASGAKRSLAPNYRTDRLPPHLGRATRVGAETAMRPHSGLSRRVRRRESGHSRRLPFATLNLISRASRGLVWLFQIWRQHVFDPFHECTYPARQIAPMCYDQGHGNRPATKIGYDLHQRPALEIWADPQEWRLY